MNWVKKTGSYLLEEFWIQTVKMENSVLWRQRIQLVMQEAGSRNFSIDKEGMQTIHLEAENTRKNRLTEDKKDGRKLQESTFWCNISGDCERSNYNSKRNSAVSDQAVAAVLKTDENGEAFKDGLEYGTYLVRETAAQMDMCWIRRKRKITIGEQNAQITLTFTNWKNRFILQKVSQGDGKVLQGAAFHIWTKDGSFDETKKTDANGKN